MNTTSNAQRHRRILDLLAGWSAYVAQGLSELLGPGLEELYAEEAAVNELYQRIGAVESFTHEDYENAMREIGNIVRTGSLSDETA